MSLTLIVTTLGMKQFGSHPGDEEPGTFCTVTSLPVGVGAGVGVGVGVGVGAGVGIEVCIFGFKSSSHEETNFL